MNRLKILAVSAIMVLLLLATAYWATSISFGMISEASALSIEIGMHKDEVVKRLGKPRRVSSTNVWYYRVRGVGDYFSIEFDEANRVVWDGFCRVNLL